MALSAPAALIRAHYQSAWNRIIRDAGFGGKVATWVMLTMVAVIVFLPCLFAVRLGLDLGGELAASGDAGVLRNWNGLQATFTVAFAVLGSFRLTPAFSFARFGRYPLTPLQLLLADLPASLFEVFPLLGAAATIFTNVGLAMRMPRSSPFVMLLALNGVVTLASLMFIISAFRAAVSRRRALLTVIGIATVAAALGFGLPGLRIVLKDWLPAFAQSIPGARGYAGLLAFRAGQVTEGLAGICIATGASALLVLVAAQLHRRRLMSEAEGSGRRAGAETLLRFGTPSSAVGRIFFRQLLASRAVRSQIFLPLFFTAPVALVTAMSRDAIADGKPLPDNIVSMLSRAELVPWYAIVPLLAVAMNPQIWMNQFGWDRGGLRTMLLLPLEPRDLFIGKLRGLLAFTAMQTAIGVVPLFWVRWLGPRELVVAVAAGSVALIVSTAVGHVVSIRFPRGVDGTAGVQIPLHLSWISPVTLLATGAELAGVYAICELIVKGAGLVGLCLSLTAALAAYFAILPRLAALLRANRERLIAM